MNDRCRRKDSHRGNIDPRISLESAALDIPFAGRCFHGQDPEFIVLNGRGTIYAVVTSGRGTSSEYWGISIDRSAKRSEYRYPPLPEILRPPGRTPG